MHINLFSLRLTHRERKTLGKKENMNTHSLIIHKDAHAQMLDLFLVSQTFILGSS